MKKFEPNTVYVCPSCSNYFHYKIRVTHRGKNRLITYGLPGEPEFFVRAKVNLIYGCEVIKVPYQYRTLTFYADKVGKLGY